MTVAAKKAILERRRGKIDALDARLARILAERFRVVLSLVGLKKSVRDAARERVVLARVRRLVGGKELEPAAAAVYREIMKQSRLLQRRKAC
jgi:chorismate mutase